MSDMRQHKIGWLNRPGTTGETWNAVTGCTPISAGCANCYARRMATRLAGRCGYPADDPFRVTYHPERTLQPMRWRKPRTVFVCSMGDLFHDDVSHDVIMRLWGIMEYCARHTFIVVTKRPRRIYDVLGGTSGAGLSADPLPNVWLGTTVENQQAADERIPWLLRCPAAVRFLSMEPLLRPVDPFLSCGLAGEEINVLDWVIVGGEAGPGARPMHPDWVRSIRDQCQAAGVPLFLKSWGRHIPAGQEQGTLDGRLYHEWPKTESEVSDG